MVYHGMHEQESELNIKKYGALHGAKKILGYEKHRSEEEKIEYEKIKLYDDIDKQETGNAGYHKKEEIESDEETEREEDTIMDKVSGKYDKSKDDVEEVMKHAPVAMPDELLQADEPTDTGNVKISEVEELIKELEGKNGKQKKEE